MTDSGGYPPRPFASLLTPTPPFLPLLPLLALVSMIVCRQPLLSAQGLVGVEWLLRLLPPPTGPLPLTGPLTLTHTRTQVSPQRERHQMITIETDAAILS